MKEVCHLGWALRPQKPMLFLISSISFVFVDRNVSSQLLYCNDCLPSPMLPTMMVIDSPTLEP